MIDVTLHDVLYELTRRGYSYRPDVPFQLASGQTSPEYVDCRAALSTPWLLHAVAAHLFGEIRARVVAIGGLTMGADPLAVAISLKSLQSAERVGIEAEAIRWFSVRKEAKAHGTKGRIVGVLRPGDPVVVIDDVATTGQSTISAIRACREEGLVVKQAQVVLDREAGGLEAIQEVLDEDPVSTARAYALFTLSEVRAMWKASQVANG